MKSSFNIKRQWNKILKGSSDGQWSQVSILSIIERKFLKGSSDGKWGQVSVLSFIEARFWLFVAMGNEVKFQY